MNLVHQRHQQAIWIILLTFITLKLVIALLSRWSPRLIFQYDYASGDDDPNDADNNRFDTLYGARRFDFGPTGIYGPFARANLSTPGMRIKLKPAANMLLAFLHYAGIG